MDPFDPSGGDLPPQAYPSSAQTFQSPGFWSNLANFGAATSMAANARGPGGFLAYGPGNSGALGSGMLQAQQIANQNAMARAQLTGQNLENTGRGIQNAMAGYQLAFMPQRMQLMSDVMGSVLGNNQGGNAPSPSGASASGSKGSVDFSQAIANLEGDNTGAINKGGYVGKYQIGEGAMTDAGLYVPAPGEDVAKNGWKGKINIAPFQPMTVQQFAANPQAQEIAFQAHRQSMATQAQRMGLNQYVGQSIGGVPINPATIAAGMHFGGATGMQKFLSTGGQYDPADANGTRLSSYMLGVAHQMSGAGAQGNGSLLVPPGMPMPQQALTRADALMQRGMAMNMMFPGSGAGMLTEAQQLRDYALKSLYPITLRPKGAAITPQGVYKDQEPERIQNPEGQETYAGMAGGISLNGRPISPPEVMPMTVGPTPGAGSGVTGGNSQTGVGASPAEGTPAVAQIAPGEKEYLEKRGADFAQQQEQIDTEAKQAIESNYLFQNLRDDSKTWTMGRFADLKGEIMANIQGIAGQFLGADMPKGWEQHVVDWQSFKKSTGQLVRQAVRETSSRAAVQEYQMIQGVLPSPEMSRGAFTQIADQWQGLNDYKLAKQQFMQSYRGKPQDLNVEMNRFLSPTAFMFNRMAQTPEGLQNMQRAIAELQKTPSGKNTLDQIMREYNYALRNGYFAKLPGGLEQQAAGQRQAAAAPVSQTVTP